VIGYPSGQDGEILPTGITCCGLREKIPGKPYNEFFIDQACSVEMAGFWPHFSLAHL